MTGFTFYSLDDAPKGSGENLEKSAKAIGFLPDLLAGLAESPAALSGYLIHPSAG